MAGEDRDHLSFPNTNDLWSMTDNQIQREIDRAKSIADYSNSLQTDGRALDFAFKAGDYLGGRIAKKIGEAWEGAWDVFTEYSGSVGIRNELTTEIGATKGKWRDAQDFISSAEGVLEFRDKHYPFEGYEGNPRDIRDTSEIK
ncbi:hypothetical protein [Ruegeria atlantica]|uniref:hypothetical protein n=1 Tax=Ruegeria atlantica TaxID=81569 RepID=UPI00147C1491|nr:hypothetical protein [Ruegeria atlantica]